MQVITFYSFKGGVGRTMALVNVAAELVKWGRRVLVVDFDLEAPGLETYKDLKPKKHHPGVVEYVTKFYQTWQVPDVGDYIYQTRPIGEKRGQLWVMPAGKRDEQYRRDLIALDWKRFYKEHDGALFFEDTKMAWEKLDFKPDYVLIDSRTGDTDVKGICTRQLPDSVVLMFAPNEQNLAGLEGVYRAIRREETEGLRKQISLHFVAANVPDLDDENLVVQTQLEKFRKRLEFQELTATIYRYENLDLLNQSIFVIDRPRSKLARAYQELTKTLLKNNLADRDGALLFMQDYALSLVPRIEYDVSAARDLKLNIENKPRIWLGKGFDNLSLEEKKKDPLNRIASAFAEEVEILNKMAECRILRGDFQSAERVLDHSLKLNPSQTTALFWRVHCKVNVGKREEAADDILGFLRWPQRDRQADQSVLQKLGHISLDRLVEATDLLHMDDGLSRSNCISVARWLCATKSATAHAAKILQKVISTLDSEERQNIQVSLRSLEEEAPTQHATGSIADMPVFATPLAFLAEIEDLSYLLDALAEARCWPELIQIIGEDEIEKLKSFEGIALLAIACWAISGADKPPEKICRLALEPEVRSLGLPFGDCPCDCTCWIYWGIGEPTKAAEALDRYEHAAREYGIGYGISPWTLYEVSIEEFANDCQLVRRVLQGEILRPAFLDPAGRLAGHTSAGVIPGMSET